MTSTESVPRFRPSFLGRAALLSAAFLAGAGVLASGRMECTFARLLHAPCPACGSTRSMHALAHLDFAAVVHFNPVAPLVAAVIAALAARAVYVMARDGNVDALGDAPIGAWTVKLLVVSLGLQVAVWALRFFGLFGGACPV